MTRIILSPDGLPREDCLSLTCKVGEQIDAVKIHDLYDDFGPEIVQEILEAGARQVWVDFKFHDIPATVARRAAALVRSGASILTTHASGGVDMMKAALDSGASEVFAVTLLTSLNDADAEELYGKPRLPKVLELAHLAKRAGVHGIVCSALEVGRLAQEDELRGMTFVVPGTRSPGVSANDQKCVDTPAHAVAAGARVLVVGREVTEAKDPLAALANFESNLPNQNRSEANG